LVVTTGAVDCVERIVSRMTYYEPSDTQNQTYLYSHTAVILAVSSSRLSVSDSLISVAVSRAAVAACVVCVGVLATRWRHYNTTALLARRSGYSGDDVSSSQLLRV